jgi:hypothetical protein
MSHYLHEGPGLHRQALVIATFLLFTNINLY